MSGARSLRVVAAPDERFLRRGEEVTSNATSDFLSDGQADAAAFPSPMKRDPSGSPPANFAHEPSPESAGATSAGAIDAANPAIDAANPATDADNPGEDAGMRVAPAETQTDAIEFRVTCPDSPARRLRLCGNRYSLGCGEGCSIRLGDDGLLPLHAVLIREPDRVLIRAHSVPLEINGDRVAEGTLRLGDRLRLGSYLFELVGTHLPAFLDDATRYAGATGDAVGEGQPAVPLGDDSPSIPDEPLESAEFDRRPRRFGPGFDASRIGEPLSPNRQATDAVREQLEEERRRLEAKLQEKICELEEAIRRTRTETDRLRDEHRKANEHLREASDELCLLRESNRDLVKRLEQTRSELRQAVGELDRRPTRDAFDQLRQQLAEAPRPSHPDAHPSLTAAPREPQVAVSQGWQTPRSLAGNDHADSESQKQPDRLQGSARTTDPGGPAADPGGPAKRTGDPLRDLPEPDSHLPRQASERSAGTPSDEGEESSLARQLIRELQDETAGPRPEDGDVDRFSERSDDEPSAEVENRLPPRATGDRATGDHATGDHATGDHATGDFAAGRVPTEATEWMAGELPADPRDSGLATESAGGWAASPAVGWDDERVTAGDDPSDSPDRDRETQEHSAGTADTSAGTEASQPEETEDDSIEAYMNRLLQRVQGTTDLIPPASADPEPKTDLRKAGPAGDPLDTDGGLPGPSEELTPADPETSSIPRSLAPEKGETLSSLRQVANDSAHAAIVRSVRTQIRDLRLKTALKGTAGLVTLATGVAAWQWMHGGLRVVGVIASLVVTGFFLVEAFGLLRETRRRSMALDAAGKVVARDEAVPEVG